MQSAQEKTAQEKTRINLVTDLENSHMIRRIFKIGVGIQHEFF